MEAALSDKVKDVGRAAEAFGTRLEPSLDLLDSTFIQAAKVESTAPEDRTTELSAALESKLGLVEDIQEALIDGDVLFRHITAITDATGAFEWVVSDNPVEHMKNDISNIDQLLKALRSMSDPSHSEFADAIDAFMQSMLDYVVQNHPTALTFIQTAGAPDDDASASQDDPQDNI